MSARSVISALSYGLISNKAPVAYSPDSGGFGGYGYGGGGPLDQASSVGTLFAIIDLLSTSVAGTDWHLYRKNIDGRRVYGPQGDNRREVTQHAALSLINRPNPLMTRNELFERSQQHIDLLGECFWLVVTVGGIPLELWPVRPDRMEEVVQGGELRGWEYREPDGRRTYFKNSEVIHVMKPSPSNPWRGIAPVHALMTDLEATKLAGLYSRNFFLNNARPGGIIEVPEMLGDTQFNRLRMQWREQHAGVNNAHRVGLLENGAKWVDNSVSNKDMEFVELRNLSRELIREAYRIHPHMLGQSENVNKANADAASADFGRYLLKPRLERFELALNTVLLPMFGETSYSVEFCYDDPIPEFQDEVNSDRDSRIAAAVALINAGADPEEALEAFGLPPVTFKAPATSSVPVPPPTPDQLRAVLNLGGRK